jgi:hypothetical protein
MPPHPGWNGGRDALSTSWLMPSDPNGPQMRSSQANGNWCWAKRAGRWTDESAGARRYQM